MRVLLSAALAAVSLLSLAPAHATDVGVSVQISQPGVYGRIDVGRFPQPAVVVQQPVVIQQPAYVVAQPQPVYLWVPPGHQKKWRSYCGRYNACGVPVYFVQDRWYRQHVLPHRGERHDHGDRGRRHDHDHDRGGRHDRDDHHHGHGHGRGHDKH
ncbi:hypothetical protein [uncultured Azohydromonas sp.]|jgi:hypothetical protein|uniref:hypothetical protein n=1 Tax=uncultured Azohydromonas sp. TaxID=487342 RepID=UPI002627300F|nr:hypothetical protein [uncultured Azohydromonas sp.]